MEKLDNSCVQDESLLQNIPKHIAVIMDGNGRWAKRRYFPRVVGHKVGVESVKNIISMAIEYKVKFLTLFAFSSENWQRPSKEVEFLLQLIYTVLSKELDQINTNNIRLKFIGNISACGNLLSSLAKEATEKTKNNKLLTVIVAVNYGGRDDIVQATRRIARDVSEGTLHCQNITENLFEKYLYTADIPAPDLFIRTSGEMRLSNFLLWQLAYTEIYFADICWPDFDKKHFLQALNFYNTRNRTFGNVCEDE